MARFKQRVLLPNGKLVWCSGDNVAEAIRNLVNTYFVLPSEQSTVPLLREYAEKWYRLYHQNRVSYRTAQNTRSYLQNRIYPFIGQKPLNEITHDDVQAVFDSMSGFAKSTVHNVRIILNQIMKNAIEDDLIDRNVIDSKRYVTSKKVHVRNSLSLKDAQDILDHLDQLENRDRLFVALALHTGMRRGEIYALQWEMIDLKNRLIHVRHALKLEGNAAVVGLPKSKAGIRDIPINTSLLNLLNQQQNQCGYLFSSSPYADKPMTASGITCQWNRIKKRIDVHGATPHIFRHTFATLIQPHTDIKTLQTIMGHADIETTLDRYTHFVHENVAALTKINPYCDTLVTHDAPQPK